MPGIYLRATSNTNWFTRERESLLTVPGSYWLCNKKNIYKFIFRYHRIDRTVKQFGYARELMKIIRKILKCQPSQGQQYGTKHLLVIYNHTSWTRQDKMFAMLKFREHSNASAFSHAFVLTIKIIDSEQKNTATIAQIPSTVKDSYTETCNNEDSDSTNEYTLLKDKSFTSTVTFLNTHSTTIEDTNIRGMQLAEGSKFKTLRTLSPQENILTNEGNRCVKVVKSHSDNVAVSGVNSNTLFDSAVEVGQYIKSNDLMSTNILSQEVKYPRTLNAETMPLSKKRATVSHLNTNNCEADDKESVKMAIDLPNQNVQQKDESSIDSANLPFQYFIEEDIEKTKFNTNLSESLERSKNDSQCDIVTKKLHPVKNHIQMSPVHSLENYEILSMYCDGKCTKEELECDCTYQSAADGKVQADIISTLFRNGQSNQRHIKECKKKSELTNNSLRSSDITDLVMEGVMFTIRKDQDSIKVVEQKTKLEVDEVLENSEKTETKEGEKRLLNSSLLRLENLVTMLEPPGINEKRDSKTESLLNLGYFSSFLDNQSSNSNIHPACTKTNSLNDIDIQNTQENLKHVNPLTTPEKKLSKIIDVTSYTLPKSIYNTEKYVIKKAKQKEISLKDGKEEREEQKKEMLEEKELEEEEDIVPEALQSTKFSLSQDLLMDSTEVESKVKPDSSVSNVTWHKANLNNLYYVRNENKFAKIENRIYRKCSSNVPRIISNKIITLDQMSPALQNAIKNKLLKCEGNKSVPLNKKTLNSVCKTPSVENFHDDITPNFNDPTDINKTSQICVNHTDRLETVNMAVVNCTKESNTNMTTDNFMEVNRRKLEEAGTSSRLQDVTKDFYEGLECHQKTDNDSKRIISQQNVVENAGSQVKMLKFIQDITRGAKVVIERINTKDISNKLRKVPV